MSNQNAIDPTQTIIQVIWKNHAGYEVTVQWPDGAGNTSKDKIGIDASSGPLPAALNAEDILSFSVSVSGSIIDVDLRFESNDGQVTSFAVSCPAGTNWLPVPFTREHDSGPYTITLVVGDDGFVIVGTVELVDTSHLPT